MELKQIEFFVRVADLKSFTRAAVMLGVSQPALSRQVRLLETELRQTLLHRNGRGVELTAPGECFLVHGRQVLESARRATEAMETLRTDPSGRVIVGLPSRLARLLTAPLARAFRERFPHATLTIAEGLSAVLDEWLLLGRVEIAVLIDPSPGSDLDLEPLHSEELVLVGPRGGSGAPESIALREIGRYPLVLPRAPNSTRNALEAATGKLDTPLIISTEIDTLQGVLELVESRMGYGVMPIGAVRSAGGEARFRMTRIHSPSVHHHLFLATSKHGKHTRLATEVARLIRAQDLPRLLG